MPRPNTGSVRPRGEGKWELAITSQYGQRIYETFCGTRAEAEIRLAEMIVEDARGVSIAELMESGGNKEPEPALTLSDYWHDVYYPYIQSHLAKSTVKGYRRAWLAYVERLFGDAVMDELTTREIEAGLWTIALPGNQRAAFKLLRQMYNQAFGWEMVSANPMARRINLRRPNPYEPDVYSAAELSQLLDVVRGSRDEAAIICLAFGGLRKEEGLALLWSDISHKDGITSLSVSKALVESGREIELKCTKTVKSTRTVFISGEAADRLEELHEQMGLESKKALVPGRYIKGVYDRPCNFFQRYRRLLRSSDLRYLPPKALRTTYATRLQEAGVDSAVISAMLGHSNYSTAYRHYFAANANAYLDAARALGRAVESNESDELSDSL